MLPRDWGGVKTVHIYFIDSGGPSFGFFLITSLVRRTIQQTTPTISECVCRNTFISTLTHPDKSKCQVTTETSPVSLRGNTTLSLLTWCPRQHPPAVVERPRIEDKHDPLVSISERRQLIRSHFQLWDCLLHLLHGASTREQGRPPIADALSQGYDQNLLSGLQAVPSWNAYFPLNATQLGLVSASLFLPAIISAFVADWLANKYGRRPAVWLAAFFIFVGSLVMGLSNGVGMFVAARVICGIGGGFGKTASPALLQELAHPRLRAILGCLFYPTYFWGSITAAWLCCKSACRSRQWVLKLNT